MANKDLKCRTRTAMLRELYWGCGGGVMECFSGAITDSLPNAKPHPSCCSQTKPKASLRR